MKIVLFSVVFLLSSFFANGQTVTLNRKDANFWDVFKSLIKQANVSRMIDKAAPTQPVTVNFSGLQLEAALRLILVNQPYNYEIRNATVHLYFDASKMIYVAEGIVTDVKDKPISDATVKIKSSEIATVTDANGSFRLKNVKLKDSLEITHIGFKNFIVIYEGTVLPAIQMESITSNLDLFDVKGYYNTPSILNTGSTSRISFSFTVRFS